MTEGAGETRLKDAIDYASCALLGIASHDEAIKARVNEALKQLDNAALLASAPAPAAEPPIEAIRSAAGLVQPDMRPCQHCKKPQREHSYLGDFCLPKLRYEPTEQP